MDDPFSQFDEFGNSNEMAQMELAPFGDCVPHSSDQSLPNSFDSGPDWYNEQHQMPNFDSSAMATAGAELAVIPSQANLSGDVVSTSHFAQQNPNYQPYTENHSQYLDTVARGSLMENLSDTRRPQSIHLNTATNHPPNSQFVPSPSEISPGNESAQFQYRSHDGRSEWFGFRKPELPTRQAHDHQNWPRNYPQDRQSQDWQHRAYAAEQSASRASSTSQSSFTPLNYAPQNMATGNAYAPHNSSFSTHPSFSTQRTSHSTNPTSFSGSNSYWSSVSTQSHHGSPWGSVQSPPTQSNASYSQYFGEEPQQYPEAEPDPEDRPKRGRKRGSQALDDYGDDKRPEFLERNRKAAAKCRAKKKADDEALQEQKNCLEHHNAALKVDLAESQGKLRRLREFAVDHRLQGCDRDPDVANSIPEERYKMIMGDPTNTAAINALKDRIQGAEKVKFQRPDAIRYKNSDGTAKHRSSPNNALDDLEEREDDFLYENDDEEE